MAKSGPWRRVGGGLEMMMSVVVQSLFVLAGSEWNHPRADIGARGRDRAITSEATLLEVADAGAAVGGRSGGAACDDDGVVESQGPARRAQWRG